MSKAKENYFIGRVTKVEDRKLYKIRVSITDIADDVVAFPLRGEVDEPRIGELVLLYNIDEVFGSCYLYSKVKEDEFLGFRSNGKYIVIEKDKINIMVKKPGSSIEEEDKNPILCSITLNNSGEINIESKSNIIVKSPNVVVKGPGTLEMKGQVAPDPEGGPFCAMKVCPVSGAPVSGSKVILGG